MTFKNYQKLSQNLENLKKRTVPISKPQIPAPKAVDPTVETLSNSEFRVSPEFYRMQYRKNPLIDERI